MSLLDYLRENRATASTALLSYLKNKSENGLVHVFHEGKDDPAFYGKFLSEEVELKMVKYYNCGNKTGVIAAAGKIGPDSQRFPLLFFADSDWDFHLGEQRKEHVFYTKYYSIESYIYKLADMPHLLCAVNGLPHEKDDLLKQAILDITQAVKDFTKAMKIVSLAVIAMKRLHGKGAVNYSDVKINNFISFNGTRILFNSKNFIREIAKKSNLQNIGVRNILAESGAVDTKRDPAEWIRGKWALSFLLRCIEVIPTSLLSGHQIKYTNKINNSNAIPISVGLLKIPEINSYIQERIAIKNLLIKSLESTGSH